MKNRNKLKYSLDSSIPFNKLNETDAFLLDQ